MRKRTTLTPPPPVPPKTAPPARVLGIDLGDRTSDVCVLSEVGGEVLERFKVEMSPGTIEATFSSYRGSKVAIEAGAQSPWVSRSLAKVGLSVVVANANQLALITQSKRKTDRVDAELLARLLRSDVSLLRPIEHRSEQHQAHLELLRARDAAVRSRTLQINHVRGALKAAGVRVPSCDAGAFHRIATDYLPTLLVPALRPMVRSIKALTTMIRRYDRDVDRLGKDVYPETNLLREVVGVGPVTSLAYVLVIANPKRFRKSRLVGAYLGLVPGLSQSGESNPQKRITKAGNAYLRRLLVQAAQYITGPFGPDCTLRRLGARLTVNGGSRAKKRAVVAAARHLAVTLHRIWSTGEAYDPMRGIPQPEPAEPPAC